MALLPGMMTPATLPSRKRSAVIAVLFLSLVVSGFSKIDLGAHPAEQVAHLHDVHDHAISVNAQPMDSGGLGDTGVTHSHDYCAPALALLPALNVNAVVHSKATERTPPPGAHPPDNLITPLHRPPIV